MRRIFRLSVIAALVMSALSCSEKIQPPVEQPEDDDPRPETPALELNVVGRYLKDSEGNIVNLHGFGQTYSPFFNQGNWDNYDMSACVAYNKRMINAVLAAGWEMDFVRVHMDPYWSDDPDKPSVRYEGHERFSEERFKKALDGVFVPMVEYIISKGLYVVMRPPGVCPEEIAVGDDYQFFLLKVWDIVSRHEKLKNNGRVMFELANEPIKILGEDGTYGMTGDGHFNKMREYFQAVVNKIRHNGAKNIIWVPGLGYQSQYAGYASRRIEGENIGYAVHAYPGWYGSDAEQPSAELGGVTGGGYHGFQSGWDAQVKPVADFAPVMVTEMDWAPAKYDSSWGKSITGVAGGKGFGANFKFIADGSGNVSWMIFTSQELLAQFKDEPGTPGNYTFLNDPEACPWPVYHWYKEYAGKADGGSGSGSDPGSDPGKPEPSYDNLQAYDFLKNYVDRSKSPDFKLGAAINTYYFRPGTREYDMAVSNFDEMTAENAMKQASIMRSDGSMDFSAVRTFLDNAEKAGMTVYGHALAWHSQQQTNYLESLVAGKKVEGPQFAEEIIVEADFDDGTSPLIGWGNNSTRVVEDGVLKITNPSSVQNWEAQFAYDVQTPFRPYCIYKLKFRIKGSSKGVLSSGFQIVDGYKSAGEFPDVSFGTEWKEVEIECECANSWATRLIFSFGSYVGDIYIDDFAFIDTGKNYTFESLQPGEVKDILTGEMDRWIKAVMEVTATKVSAWDAVNEAISRRDSDGDGYYDLESSGSADNFYWQNYLGSVDYVRIVIEKARKYYEEYGGTAPLKLFINDYNLESDWDGNMKLKSLLHWIGIWESDGVTKIDGIGTQMHISYHESPDIQKNKEQHYVNMLQLMADTGKLVKISELDMGYVDKNGNQLSVYDLTDSQHRAMADYYEFIVRKYFEIVPPAQQYGITLWCPVDPVDSGAWRAGEPVGLWDSNFNRKYAYAGFAEGLIGNSR